MSWSGAWSEDVKREQAAAIARTTPLSYESALRLVKWSWASWHGSNPPTADTIKQLAGFLCEPETEAK
jgi:hypothetical protein